MPMTIATLAALAMLTTTSNYPSSRGSTETDTTFNVPANARLELDNFSGEIAVRTWTRNAVRIEADHGSRVRIDIDVSGSTVSIRAHDRRGMPTTVDYQLTVPAAMGLELSGVSTEISVAGSKGEIKASTVNGDVDVEGGVKFVSLNSVEGAVKLTGARGRMELSSVNEGIEVHSSVGDVVAETVNGDIELDVDAANVEASTVNGSLLYGGPYKDDGVYTFSTHNGDIRLTMTDKTSATVSVATFSGDFNSSFPLQLSGTRRGKRFEFKLGTGKARVEVESFQGTIRIARPGEVDKYKYKNKDKHDPDVDVDPDDDESR